MSVLLDYLNLNLGTEEVHAQFCLCRKVRYCDSILRNQTWLELKFITQDVERNRLTFSRSELPCNQGRN